jgi:hypothetical protein
MRRAEAIIADAEARALEIQEAAKEAHEAERKRGYEDGRDEARIEAAERMIETTSRTIDYFSKIENDMVELVLGAVQKIFEDFDDKKRVITVVRSALGAVRNQKQMTPQGRAAERRHRARRAEPAPGGLSRRGLPRHRRRSAAVGRRLHPRKRDRHRRGERAGPDRRPAQHLPQHPRGEEGVKQFDYIAEMMRVALVDTPTLQIRGRVTQVIGTIIKAVVPTVKIGEVCMLKNPGESFSMQAEVVGFSRDAALLTPIGDMYGISAATEVIPTGRQHLVPVASACSGAWSTVSGGPSTARSAARSMPTITTRSSRKPRIP